MCEVGSVATMSPDDEQGPCIAKKWVLNIDEKPQEEVSGSRGVFVSGLDDVKFIRVYNAGSQ